MTSNVTADPPATPPTGYLDRSVLLVAGVVVVGAIMSILDITVVSVAQQDFQQQFDVNAAESAWTMTGYTLALATVIPLTGWAADRFGTKRLYLLAILFFALGSALCALATSLPMLVTFRVIQGLGGGMLMPLGMTILTRAAGPERVGRVMAVLGIPMLLGPICGPILGGWLIDVASWHWIFLINIPIGVVALVYAWLILPRDHVEPSESFDFLGMLLLSPGLAVLLYGISMIPETGTFAATKVVVPVIIGAALVVAFVPWALNPRNRHPLVDLRLFANKELTVAVITLSVFCVAFFGAGLLFPQYYQFVRGEDSLHAGLLLAPQGLGAMVTMPLAGALADRIGPGKVVMTGVTIIVVGMFLFSTLDESTPYWFLLLSLFIMGLGMGCTMMPTFAAAQATLREHTIARGSTLVNIVQQVAASVGTAIFTVLLTNGIKDHPTTAGAYVAGLQSLDPDHPDPSVLAQLRQLAGTALPDLAGVFGNTFLIATIMVACCLVPAFFLPRSKAEHGGAAPSVMH
ncbi:MAG: DHA2 family efflux MFS transporter permease subunit [Nocardioides sp.]|uniref:DHA2 family efflux MFS transporter permease subunit n=1 Tax=Nocardioides sp. TaxID=35761 RepID=UPI0039E2A2F0